MRAYTNQLLHNYITDSSQQQSPMIYNGLKISIELAKGIAFVTYLNTLDYSIVRSYFVAGGIAGGIMGYYAAIQDNQLPYKTGSKQLKDIASMIYSVTAYLVSSCALSYLTNSTFPNYLSFFTLHVLSSPLRQARYSVCDLLEHQTTQSLLQACVVDVLKYSAATTLFGTHFAATVFFMDIASVITYRGIYGRCISSESSKSFVEKVSSKSNQSARLEHLR